VHALRHVHQLLVPGGTMVDLHPLAEERVEAGGRTIGLIEDHAWLTLDLPNAEACLGDAISAGLYTLEAEIEFDLLQHFDEANDLLGAREEILAEQRDLVHRIRNATPPLVTREHCVLRRLRAGASSTHK
jgi:hypothetical protein